MVFNSIEAFEKHIMDLCKNAVSDTQIEVQQDIVELAKGFYAGYDPEMYQRTGQLDDVDKFIRKSGIVSYDSQCEGTVFLDSGSLNYVTGRQPDGEYIVAAASQGLHGAMGDGLKYVSGNGARIWDDGLQAKAKGKLKKNLSRRI